MPKFRVTLTRVETIEVEAENEQDAYFVALDEETGEAELVSDYIEEIEEDDKEEGEGEEENASAD